MATPAPPPPLWQVVLTISGEPATTELEARTVLVSLGWGGIELEEEDPSNGIWLAGLPIGNLTTTFMGGSDSIIIENGEFQIEVPFP